MREFPVLLRVILFLYYRTFALCDSDSSVTEDQVYLSKNIFDSTSGDNAINEPGVLVSRHISELIKRHSNFASQYPSKHERNIVNGRYQYYLDKPGNKLSEWRRLNSNNKISNNIYWTDNNINNTLYTTENYIESFDTSINSNDMYVDLPISTPLYDEIYENQPDHHKSQYIRVDCGDGVVKLRPLEEASKESKRKSKPHSTVLSYDTNGRIVAGTHIDEMGNKYKILCIQKLKDNSSKESESEKQQEKAPNLQDDKKNEDQNTDTSIQNNQSTNVRSKDRNENLMKNRLNEFGNMMKRHMTGTQEEYDNELRRMEQSKLLNPEAVISPGELTGMADKETESIKQTNKEIKTEVQSFLDGPGKQVVSSGMWNGNNNKARKSNRNYVPKEELVYWHPNKKITNHAEEVKPNGIKLLQDTDWTKNKENMIYTVDNRPKSFFNNPLNKNIQIIQEISTVTPILNQDLPRTVSSIVMNSVFNHQQNKIKFNALNRTMINVPLHKHISKINPTSFFSAAVGEVVAKAEPKDKKKLEFFNGDAVIRYRKMERNKYSYPWHSVTNKFGGQIMEAKIFSRTDLKPSKAVIEEIQNKKVEKPLNFFEIKHYDFEESPKASSHPDQNVDKETALSLYREGKANEPINFSATGNVNSYSTVNGPARKFTRKTVPAENNIKNTTFYRHYQSSNTTVYKPKYYYNNSPSKEKSTFENLNQTNLKKTTYQPNQIQNKQSSNQFQMAKQQQLSSSKQPQNLQPISIQQVASNQVITQHQKQLSIANQALSHTIQNTQVHSGGPLNQVHQPSGQLNQQFPTSLPRSHSKPKNYPKTVPIFRPKGSANKTAKSNPCYEESLNSITFTNRVLRKPNKKCIPVSEETTDKIEVSTSVPFKKHFNIKIAEDSCQTADGEYGTCVNLYHCLPSMRDGITDTDLMKLVYCGFDGIVPMVCCPSSIKAKHQPSILKIMLTPRPSPNTQTNKKRYSNFDLNVPQKPPYCGRSSHVRKTVNRDANGFTAELGHFPWMALLGYGNSTQEVTWTCSGSLITSQHVLSTAYCIVKNPSYVRVGELDLSDVEDGASPQDMVVQMTIVHEHYNSMVSANDIGIVILKKEVKFSQLISPVCLPVQQSVQDLTFEKYMPVLAGWKLDKNGTYLQSQLRAYQLPVVTTRQCAKSYGKIDNVVINENVLCAGFRKTSLLLDSGAPLMQLFWNDGFSEPFYYQIGILSTTQQIENPQLPAVFTRITHFLPWIEKQLAQLHLL